MQLLQFKVKQNILRKAKILKGTDTLINEDTIEYRKELWEEVKLLRNHGKIAYLNYRTIISRDKVSTTDSELKLVSISIVLFLRFTTNGSVIITPNPCSV